MAKWVGSLAFSVCVFSESLFSVQYFYLQLSLVPFSLKTLFYLSQRVNFQPFSVEVGGVLVYLGVATGRVGKESEI